MARKAFRSERTQLLMRFERTVPDEDCDEHVYRRVTWTADEWNLENDPPSDSRELKKARTERERDDQT